MILLTGLSFRFFYALPSYLVNTCRRSLSVSRMRENLTYGLTRGNEVSLDRIYTYLDTQGKPGHRAMVDSKFDVLLSLLYRSVSCRVRGFGVNLLYLKQVTCRSAFCGLALAL